MKKFFLMAITLMVLCNANAQFKISNGGQVIVQGNVIITLNNLSFENNGSFATANSTFRFTGSGSNTIGGSSANSFYNLQIEKSPGISLKLLDNISVNNQIVFTSGLLELNQKNVLLSANASLTNENESSRITGVNGGEVMITVNMNAPYNANPGNLGSVFTSNANLGTVIIKRGHKLQTGNGLTTSINRYFDIQPSNNSNLDGALEFHYFDAELNGQPESTLAFFQSSNGGSNWSAQSILERNTTGNYIRKASMPSFYRYTLGAPTGGALPVTGLEFSAKRTTVSQVQLGWMTYQEINNKGFYIERQKQNETSYSVIGFVATKASGGNSATPLSYQYVDNNDYSGKTYYRLKQEDIDGTISYSKVQIVQGVKGKNVKLTSYPNPSSGEFSVLVDNSDEGNVRRHYDAIQIFDISGHLVKQINVQYNTPLKINGLMPGVYIIKLGSDNGVYQKQIVQ